MRNFVVSFNPTLWISDCKDLFIAEPLVYHNLEKAGKLGQFNSIVVSEYTRGTKQDLVDDNAFVDNKYEKYIKILSNRLNIIHCKNYSTEYWRKSLSMGFIRYITAFYDSYKIYERDFDFEAHICNVIPSSVYFTPNDFEDHRNCFQNSDFGQEQIFSIYMQCFYPGKSELKPINYSKALSISKFSITDIRRSRFFNFLKSLHVKLKYGFWLDKISIGILGSYFSKENINKLSNGSSKKISPIVLPTLNYERFNKLELDIEARKILSKPEVSFDRFDVFFFKSIEFCFPKIFIELYSISESILRNKLNRYSGLKYVTSENWISNTQNALSIAILQQRGVLHINNEHNCLFHPFEGTFVNNILKMVDTYTTLGWSDTSCPKVISSGSLFPFVSCKNVKKENKILFVAAPSIAKATHFSGAWGYAQEKVPRTVDFNNKFFESLSESTLSDILYRGYPTYKTSGIQMYDKEYYYKDFSKKLRFSDFKKSGRQEMSESDLVIIDYISTSYLESLMMNLPTIFFWDQNSYYLSDKYMDFFQPLIDVNICQTDSIKAAEFIEYVKDDVFTWWHSAEVQTGKQKFLERNIGGPHKLLNYLIGLSD